MKLIRFGEIGKERAGVILDEKMYDASGLGEDYNESFFENDGLERLSNWLLKNQGDLIEIPQGSRIGSCVARPSKIVCILLTMRKNLVLKYPKSPLFFSNQQPHYQDLTTM
jgi:2,4-didehydro-3-deoxy-L-rhamnonate hydrolase